MTKLTQPFNYLTDLFLSHTMIFHNCIEVVELNGTWQDDYEL
jgi:hypothetical protein